MEPLAKAGVGLSLTEGWQPVEPARWAVPGKPLAAWSGPEGSSLVVYQALPWPGGTAEMIGKSLATRLSNLPELKIVERRIASVAGQEAVRVESIAPGTGSSLAASGLGKPVAPADQALVPTRQVVVAFPRPGGVLYLAWHMPDPAHETLKAGIDAVLGSLRLSIAGGPSSYSY